MTPRSLQLGLTRWLRVTGANVVTGHSGALTIDSARVALPCGPDEAVVSAASYALGAPMACRLAATQVDDPEIAVRRAKRKAVVKRARQAMRARRKASRAAYMRQYRADHPEVTERDSAQRRQRKAARHSSRGFVGSSGRRGGAE